MSRKAQLREWFKERLHAAGFDLRRLNAYSSPALQLELALRHFGIDLVLDVGANAGQFGAQLRTWGYGGRIVSFEPLSAAHAALAARAKGDPKWHVHPRAAVGDHDGTIEINVAENSYSSSILPKLDTHRSDANRCAYVAVESVPVVRLDSVAASYLEGSAAPFLKMDTQGFEMHVLDGATGILPCVRGVLSELSIVPLYEGQPLWLEMLARLEGEGFTLWAIQPELIDPRHGRSLQMDGIWFRP